jgi:hypothetical protein
MGVCARMHCSARRAGYPSVSSRAARQQPPGRTRLAGGGPQHHTYAVDRLRHLRHRFRPPRGRAVPPVCRPGAGPGEKPPPPPPAAVAGPGAVHLRHRHWAAAAARWRCLAWDYESRVGNPPPPPHPAAAASRGRCRPGRCPGGAPWATETPHVAVSRAPLGPLGERIAGLDRHCRARAPRARTVAVGQCRGRVALNLPEVTAEDAVHCAARAAVRVDTRALAGGRAAGLDRHRGAGAMRPDASGGASVGAGLASE